MRSAVKENVGKHFHLPQGAFGAKMPRKPPNSVFLLDVVGSDWYEQDFPKDRNSSRI